MTLGRQLLLGISAVFLALLLGIEASYVSIARARLSEQLDAHANETATSLALSMGARMSSLDASLINIMVNPVFDRGHFESIGVRDLSGGSVFSRSLDKHEILVPQWFVGLVAFDAPTGEALISAGWRQLGRVAVKVHPQYAYKQLYDTARATLALLAVLFALALLAMRYYLSGILKPLHEIERVALAIGNRNFALVARESGARELQRVTHAINSMSSKIREAIAQDAARAERLRREAFEDPLTGQLNRRGFEQSVSALLDEGGDIHAGALALFSLSGLAEVNLVFGLTRGNDILKRLSDALAMPSAGGSAVVGRWQGPTLAAFLPDAEQPQSWADGICRAFADRLRAEDLPSAAVVSAGVAHFSGGTATLMQLAQSAEGALSHAVGSGGMGAAVVSSRAAGADGGADLKTEIEAAIAEGRIALLGQKVISTADASVTQLEIFSSLTRSDGAAIPAAAFVPVANQHGLLAALDVKVAGMALEALLRISTLPRTVSVNVSMQSIASEVFRAELQALLARHGQLAGRLVVELTGYAASRSPRLTREFASEMRKLGVRVALDNFDLDRNAMTIAHELLPAYIKLAPAFTQQIGVREDLRFIVEAMVRMLRPLEIPLIAQGVEDASTIPVLAELGLAAYQGYAGGRPEPFAAV